MTKLSKTQKEVIREMKYYGWVTAYMLECRITTLRALEKKGLVISKLTEHSDLWPAHSVYYKLKEGGFCNET